MASKAFVMNAYKAENYGALAVLVRSTTDLSLYSPHIARIGNTYADSRFPGASITVEDAELISRLSDEGTD